MAKIESEFTYKACCNDGSGLKPLKSTIYQPSFCSKRMCHFNDHLAHSLWFSEKAMKTNTLLKSTKKCLGY